MTDTTAPDPVPRPPVAAVTGARRGIGAGIARALAAEGFDLVLLDIVRDAAAEQLLAELAQAGGRARFVVADIADVGQRETTAAALFDAFGALDCLVNNAGVQVEVRGDPLETTPESFDRVLGVNLRGTFFLTQAVARRMIAAAPLPGRHRAIVSISSANAFFVSPDRPEYCFSKVGLSMMTKVFALRLGAAGISTYEVRPGVIRTDMTAPVADRYQRMIAGGFTPIARWGEPEDVGRAVAALAAGRLPFSTGDAIHVDGGQHIHQR
ncbi:MAG: 3-ketoacyl-ACP reductase [Lautropia sp.]